MEINTVSLIGLGAIGSFIAPRLWDAVGHENFRIIAGGARKQRLETEGTTINGMNYKFKVVAPDEPTTPADLVIVIVKHLQLPQAVEDIRNQVGPNTTIVSFMNGISSEETLAAAYGWNRILYGLARASVVMTNHTTNYDPKNGFFLFGEADNTELSERVRAISRLFCKADIHHEIPKDMVRALWLKFMANVSENQSSAILGIPFGAWQVSIHANAVREAAMREVIAIGRKLGVNISMEDMIAQREQLNHIPYQNKTSMLQDIENKRKTEVDMLSGTVIRLGKELGVPTPVNSIFYHAIRVLEEKNEGKI